MDSSDKKELGLITRGSLIEGLEMRLAPETSIEEIKAGKFIVVDGARHRFFSLITDVRLDSSMPSVLINPPRSTEELTRGVLAGTTTYGTVEVRPMLMIEKGDVTPRPVKTIPPHFSPVAYAREDDVSDIFGSEDQGAHFFNIGTPLDMETPVCLDLERFVERSNGIFGKSGTGKTFLTRVVLSGIIRNDMAVNLIFDMHNEYGWDARQEGGGGFVKGLKQLFDRRVAIFSLDPESTRHRGGKPDVDVFISLDQIEIGDIELLQDELNLSGAAIETTYALWREFGAHWLRELLSTRDTDELAEAVGAHKGALAALHRKLLRLENLKFITARAEDAEGSINKIIDYLDRKMDVVLEFGRENSVLAYLLVANIITRRIHDRYVEKTELFLQTHNEAERPHPLMITIEEAHKFLNTRMARQTIFGTIARELRKYFVTMLIVDQRPSGIDDEVISQIGTRITAQLSDEKDIQAILTGVSNSSGLRSVLASLDSKRQALLLGHAVPMPVVIETRMYDERFYREVGDMSASPENAGRYIDESFD